MILIINKIEGQKPHAFTVSLNARYSGGPFENVLMELLTRFHHPIQLEIRQTLEKANNYSQALQYLNSVHFVAPSYIILGGIDTGSIITR
jgi:hypothetical protein